ncbi:hypothetical protein EDB87DRAFT_152254 [Lactarius vividus]|nr:hypothetical protein EDB87DRAFT_152254 [Lactarius vividus]
MQNAEVRVPVGQVRGVSDRHHMTLKMLLDSQSRAMDSLARAVDSLSGALDSQLRAPDRLFNRQQKNELLSTQRTLFNATGPCPGDPAPQTKSRSHYPESVLWTLQDYRREQGGSISRAGDYPPKMRLAIRDEDGRMISDADYKDIRSRAIHIVRRRLQPLNTSCTAGIPECKTFYKANHSDVWFAVIAELEGTCPLLTLCDSHWKAERILGSVIRYIRSKATYRQESPQMQGLARHHQIGHCPKFTSQASLETRLVAEKTLARQQLPTLRKNPRPTRRP